jgi:hypothetical protein
MIFYSEEEAVDFSETSIYFCQAVRHHIPENASLHRHSCHNLKSRMYNKLFYTWIFLSAYLVRFACIGNAVDWMLHREAE